MNSRLPSVLLCGFVGLGLLGLSSQAQARSQRNLAWRAEITWTTAVRLLRVDLGFELLERDQSARFVLFNYREGYRDFPGSLEVVERTLEDGRVGVRIIISVPAMPVYVEQNLIDRLERKLREEVGPPLPIPARETTLHPTRSEPEEEEENTGEAEPREDADSAR